MFWRITKWRAALVGLIVLGAAGAIGYWMLPPAVSAEFRPPSERQRRAAIGSTAGLPLVLRWAFDPADDFEPVPAPGRGDWLANHEEPGQTFDQFARSGANRPDSRRKKVYFLPIGDFPPEKSPSLKKLKQFADAFFGLPAEVLPAAEIERSFTSRINTGTGQRQLLTRDILAWLKPRVPPDGFFILGVTMTDLYPDDDWNYVFGQASLRERVGVYSFARYDPRFFGGEADDDVERLMLLRSCKVLGHEGGHMFGMPHCIYFNCLLNGSNHLAEADSQPLHLCPVCLRKLHQSVGFDVERRYERLRTFSREAGFDDEAKWLDDRLEHLSGGDR